MQATLNRRLGSAGLSSSQFQHGVRSRHFRIRGCKRISVSTEFVGSTKVCGLSLYPSSLSSARWRQSTRRLGAVDSVRSGPIKPEKPKRSSEKEWKSIPSTIYRPFHFPDVEEYVRGLNPQQRILHGAAFLAVLGGIAWGRNIGVTGLVDGTEPIFVAGARQMTATGDYLTPQFNGLAVLDKPVLAYWVMALSAKIFGDIVWAYRLPSCLFATGLLTGLFITVSRFGLLLSTDTDTEAKAGDLILGKENHFLAAIITAAAFALNLHVIAWGSTALPDMLLTANIGAALLCFFWGYAGSENTQKSYLLSAAFLGLAFLSGGPVGVLFPVCVCVSFLLFTGELKSVFVDEIPKLMGISIMMFINLPWYGAMYSRHGSVFLKSLFGSSYIKPFIETMNQHKVQPWWCGFAVLAVMYFPWSLSLPSALMKANPWKDITIWKESTRSSKLLLFAGAWLVAGFTLFLFSPTQLPSYYLHIAPAVALLAGSHLSLPASCHVNGLATGLAPALLYQMLAGVFFLLPGLLQDSTSRKVAAIGTHLGKKCFHQIAFVVLAAAGMLATRTEEYSTAYGSKQMSPEERVPGGSTQSSQVSTLLPLWILHTMTMLALLGLFVTPSYHVVDSIMQAPVRNLAVRAAQLHEPGEELIMVGDRMPSVVYYSQLRTAFYDSAVEVVDGLKDSSEKMESVLVICEDLGESSFEYVDLDQKEGFRLTRVRVSEEDVKTQGRVT